MTGPLVDLMPPDELMRAAWVSALMWAAGNPEVQEQFVADTGIKLVAARSAIDLMIDQATGYQEEVVLKFAAWFNRNMWGEVDGRAMGVRDAASSLGVSIAPEEDDDAR